MTEVRVRSDPSREIEGLAAFCRTVWTALREFHGVDHWIWRQEERIAYSAAAAGDLGAMRAIAKEIKASMLDLPQEVRTRILAEVPLPKGNVNTGQRFLETVVARGRVANDREYAALQEVIAGRAVELEPELEGRIVRLLSEYRSAEKGESE